MLTTAEGESVISRPGLYLNGFSWDERCGEISKIRNTTVFSLRKTLSEEDKVK